MLKILKRLFNEDGSIKSTHTETIYTPESDVVVDGYSIPASIVKPNVTENGVSSTVKETAPTKDIESTSLINLDWNRVRSIFGGKLNQDQVDGINSIISVATGSEFNVTDKRVLAYMLATSFWETGRTMQAVMEKGGSSYFHRMYDKNGSRPHVAKRLGNTRDGDGIKFAGRGHVQLTGRTNYEKMSKYLGLDLISNPDLLLDMTPSARVLVHGMLTGIFTGVGVTKFINKDKADYVNARRVINGTDKATVIAKIAKDFEKAIV